MVLEQKERDTETQNHALEEKRRDFDSRKADWNKRCKALDAERKLEWDNEVKRLKEQAENDQKQQAADINETMTKLEAENKILSIREKQLQTELIYAKEK